MPRSMSELFNSSRRCKSLEMVGTRRCSARQFPWPTEKFRCAAGFSIVYVRMNMAPLRRVFRKGRRSKKARQLELNLWPKNRRLRAAGLNAFVTPRCR
jgi:hypothetical protein